MRKIGLLTAVLSLCLISSSFAHDGVFDPIDLTSWDGTGDNDLIHDETLNNPTPEWKGWAEFSVTNTMEQAWGDFHIKLNSWESVNSVYITEDATMSWPSYNVTYSEYNAYGPTQVNFFFDGTPVQKDTSVTFRVYTNNEADENEWFGFCLYPTPVPEPATLALLGLGGLLLRRKK